MSRFTLASVCVSTVLAAGSLFGQTLSFDVASIKVSEPITPAMVQSGKIHVGMKMDNKRVDIGYFTLLQLICKAYDVKMYQVQGPAWVTAINGQHFDIVANLPDGATKEQVPEMLQSLLKERFKMEVHKESKDQSIYAMIIGKGGLKIKETEAPPPPAADPSGPNTGPSPGVTGSSSVSVSQTKNGAVVSDGTGKSQKVVPSPDGKSMRLEISGATLSEVAEGLGPLVDHPVVDMTGLKGKYDMVLEVSMADMMAAARSMGAQVPPPAPGEASEPGGSIFLSIANLGLKLEARKSPMSMIVVDKMEKTPTEN